MTYLSFGVLLVACNDEPQSSSAKVSGEASKVVTQESAAKVGSEQRIKVTQGDVTRTVTLKTEPIVDGCSMEGAMKTLSTRHEYVRLCAAGYAKRNGKPPEGRMVVSLSLKKNGDVAQAAVTEDPVGDEELNECLKEAIKVRFPNPFGKSCIVQAPFMFTGKPSSPSKP